MLLVIVYGCETWYLTLRVSENWTRRLYNEVPYDLHCSLNIVRVIKLRMRWAVRVAGMGEGRHA
jgi:hypothetical protein